MGCNPVRRFLLAGNDLVPHRSESVDQRGDKSLLRGNAQSVERADSRRIDRLLQIDPAVEQINENLHLTLGLHIRSDAAESET